MSLIQIENGCTPAELDVHEIVPRERHELIFQTFDRLAPGQSFAPVNDHDPKPLYYQFQAEQPGQVRWNYVEQGPEVWRVRIGREVNLATTPILELLAIYPMLEHVLDNAGFDTCCGGHLTVSEGAAECGADPARVIAALRQALD
jgi:uncharacterized protein (DUF2249 family)